MSASFGEDPKSASLIGLLALVPQVVFVAMQLNWWYVSGREIDILTVPLAVQALTAVGAVVICPILAISSGVSLIKCECNKVLGWALVVSAPILTILAFATRPQ